MVLSMRQTAGNLTIAPVRSMDTADPFITYDVPYTSSHYVCQDAGVRLALSANSLISRG